MNAGAYVITGGTTGIGAAVQKLLQGQGYEVFNIDYKGGDYLVDLSTVEGRQSAIDEVFYRYPDGVDVLICNAGVDPTAPPKTIFALSFLASMQLAEGLWSLLKKKHGNCVITSSNSIINMAVRPGRMDMLSSVMDEERAMEFAGGIPRNLTPSCHSSSKRALARWVRRTSPSWAVDGLRVNPVVPGNIITPMTQGMTAEQMDAALLTPIPIRYGRKEFLDVEETANGIVFLMPPTANGINGVTLFVDGGTDALSRSEQI